VIEIYPLLDDNLLGSGSSDLGKDKGENTALEGSLDGVLVHAFGEGKGALELADGSLSSPVTGSARLTLLVGTSIGVGVILLDLGLRLSVVLALGATLHDQIMGVRELDLDVLLVDPGQLTIQVVSIFSLADIEAGSEGSWS